MSRIVHVLRTGKIGYQRALNLQQYIAGKFNSSDENNFRNVLILTEHNPVYTIGIRTKNYPESEQKRLEKLGAEFYRTNRGGLITFHGPGQLVAYPIFNLRHFNPSVRWHVARIEEAVIDLCNKFNIAGRTSPDTGVWVGNSKICALGIHCNQLITTHGMALNCDTDLVWFSHVVPCGLVGKGVTSISKELQKSTTIDDVTPEFLNSFQRSFQCDFVELNDDDKKEYLDQLNSK